MKPSALVVVALLGCSALAGCSTGTVDSAITVELVAEGFDKPTWAVQFPNNLARFLVLEQTSGLIRDVQNGELQDEPYLDLSDIVSNRGGEQGLLGLAFHPDYVTNGFFYLSYTDDETDATVVARYTANPLTGAPDPDSWKSILTIEQPTPLHNGGMLAFDRDGYLYIGSGDGGGSDDPDGTGQRLDTLLGKILRIDVDAGDPYAIPETNPFVNDPNARHEIWVYGVRNPWRFSFDRLTDDLYFGDVGQQKWEEVSYQPADSLGGENYGWSIAEGFHCRAEDPEDTCGTMPGFTPPIHDYDHGLSRAVTGGYVYRGAAVDEEFQGAYFFGDFITGQLWTLRYDGETVSEITERTAEIAPENGSIDMISSFYEDAAGELYILDFDGQLFKIVPNTDGGSGGGGFDIILFLENLLNATLPGVVDFISELLGFLASLFGF